MNEECKSKRGNFFIFLKNRIKIGSARVRGSNKDGRDVFFSRFLKMAKDSAARISWADHSTRREYLMYWRFSTAWYDSARFRMARLSLRFHCSLVPALEWAGLRTTAVTPENFNSTSLHHALAGSAPRLSTRGQSVLSVLCWGRSFSVVAPKLWNSLPRSLCLVNNPSEFKSLLKTHLFSECYLS